MKTTATLLTALVLLLQVPIGAAEAPMPRTVTTNGQGQVSAQADMAEIHLQATTLNRSASTAKSTVDQAINKALKALEDLGIDRKDIVASTLRINPDYQYDNRERIFSGYQATRDIRVTLRKLDTLDKVLESVTGVGINNILAINLGTSREDELKKKAFELAIADSRQKAGDLATAYGAELGNIRTISYLSNRPIVVQERASMALMKAADQGGGQYIHDSIEVEDQIQVVFDLIIPH